MKKLSPAIVSVKDIRCDIARQQFSEEKLNIAARLILDIEGIISPIIVSREGVENYRVIHGNFEYYAAMRAREIDPIRGETIDAYIAESETQETIQKQIQVFRNSYNNQVNEPMINNDSEYLETLFKSCLQPVMDRLTAIDETLITMQSQLDDTSQKVELKQPVVQSTETESTVKTPIPSSTKQDIVEEQAIQITPESIPNYLQLINVLSPNELTEKFKKLSINKSIIKAVLDNRPFESENALSAIKGVATKTIEKLQTLSDTVSKPVVIETKPSKQQVEPKPESESKPELELEQKASETDSFLTILNQMDKKDLFFKVKRATKLNDKKINQLIADRPYQALSDIKSINQTHLKKIKSLL